MEVVGDSEVPADRRNLAWQAAELFMKEADLALDVHIWLEKRVPSAAGLGGGSSDAAAVLRGLKLLTGVDADSMSLAERLGSDVPFFLLGGAVLVQGRGERMRSLPPARFNAVLLHPNVSISTSWAYAALDRMRETLTDRCASNNYWAPAEERHEGKPFPFQLDNDFLPLLVREHDQLRAIAAFLEERCHSWGLSGSGPTFYALFEGRKQARDFAESVSTLSASLPEGLGCTVCESVDSAGASSNW